MEDEDSRYRADFKFDSTRFFEKVNDTNYQLKIIHYKEKEYLRARPWSNNFILFMSYNLYRLFLLHSDLPEYIFDLNGNLIDYTGDSQDDPRYQDSWGRAIDVRMVSKQEYLQMINLK